MWEPYEWKWAGLAVLFSRELPNGPSSHNFFSYFQDICFNCFIKNPQTTNALTFLTHNIFAVGGVNRKVNMRSS